MPSRPRLPFALAALLVTAAIARHAAALAPVGAVPADFTAYDPEDRPVTLHAMRGRPTVLVYEDKDAAEQNAALKGRLVQRIRAGGLARKVNFFGVADVAQWDFWPARGFVKDELRAQRARFGLPVYADWVADARRKLDAKPGRSSILVLDAAGRAVWSSEGELDAGRERALFALIQGAASAQAASHSVGDTGANVCRARSASPE